MEDDNDILIESYIVKAVSFNGCISVTTYVLLVAAALFGKRDLKKINFKIKTGVWEAHEVRWQEYSLQVTKS